MTADAPLERVLRAFPELEAVPGATDRLAAYVALLAGYGRANVTGARGPEGVADLVGDALGLLDVAELAERATAVWADLGSGGGLPGIPLALALPGLEVTLIEAVGKKCAFLDQAVAATGLGERVIVRCGRSEELARAGSPDRARFAVVLAKAVGSLAVVVELAAPLLAPGGLLLASKTTASAAAEAAGGAAAGRACGLAPRRVTPLPRSPLPGSVGVVFEKVGSTPDRFPRRAGMAAKRPLG